MSSTDCSQILLKLLSLNLNSTYEDLQGNEESLLTLFQHAAQEVKSVNGNLEFAFTTINVILDKVWERLNIGKWDNVPSCYGALYSYASFFKVICLIKSALLKPKVDTNETAREALKIVDLGLLLGGSLRCELKKTASLLCSCITLDYNYNISKFDELPHKLELNKIIPDGFYAEPCEICACPSVETFFIKYFKPHFPVKLTGCINHWPALSKWNDIRYMYKILGPRTVPVELGSSYDSSNWSQKLILGAKFIDQYIFQDSSESQKGYLAQHQLFNQIPELLDDIREPEYCTLSENYSDDSSAAGTDINIWFGPHKTISPLHHDPKHNLLAQVVGFKRILLYDPKWSVNLYPHEQDGLLSNTAQVDPTTPDFIAFPKFQDAKPLECVLKPGEILYIPPKWWHHVVSLSASTSVSFWWDLPVSN